MQNTVNGDMLYFHMASGVSSCNDH